tara:strand:+ start:6539 stop:6757 length:219 start_codon:yes stop_codon:yes gene_type:complete
MLKNDAENIPKLSVLKISSVMRCGVVGGSFNCENILEKMEINFLKMVEVGVSTSHKSTHPNPPTPTIFKKLI